MGLRADRYTFWLTRVLTAAGLAIASCAGPGEGHPDAGDGAPPPETVAESPEAAERVAWVRERFTPVGASPRAALGPSVVTQFHVDGDGVRAIVPEQQLATARRATVRLPKHAADPTRVEDAQSGMAIEFTLTGARPDAPIEVADGIAVWRGAAPGGGDVFQRVTAEGTEDFVVVEQKPLTEEVTYDVQLWGVAGLRLVSNTLELLDDRGDPRLRIPPPFLIDAEGRHVRVALSVHGCEFDRDLRAPWTRSVVPPGARTCALRASWRGSNAAYPVLVDPQWSTTGSMATPRSEHTATLLGTGLVLVTGGGAGEQSSAELFAPAGSGSFAATGAMQRERRLHSATLLTSGRVLIAGSEISTCSACVSARSSAELYDPATGIFTLLASAMTSGRSRHTATLLASGKVLVAGGGVTSGFSRTVHATADLFDPAGAGTFTPTMNMAASRERHAATLLGSGKVLVTGGCGPCDTSPSFKGAELFDPAGTGSFSATGAMQTNRARHTATLLATGRVLVVGGQGSVPPPGVLSSSESFDPNAGANGTFAGGLAMGGPRVSHAATRLPSGDVLVFGGADGVGFGAAALSTAERFNASTGSFLGAPSMAVARNDFRGLSLASGDVLAVGGGVSSAERFDLDALGATCAIAADCESGFCVDDVCCDSACSGLCQACSTAMKGQGANGACGPVITGADPDSDCAQDPASTCNKDGFCNGAGACRLHASGTSCGAASCSGGSSTAPQCNGSGTCNPNTASCAPFACCGTACCTTCSTDANCASGSYCASPACVPKKLIGELCGGANQCASGNCVDGYCCDAPCTGTCQACSTAKKGSGANGVCGSIATNTDPDSECNADPQSSCDQNGSCNGAGACALYPAGTSCGATTCSAGTQQGQSCDGFGACNPSGTTQCTPYVCCGTACCLTCSAHTQCVGASWCRTSDSTCQPDKANGATCAAAEECISNQCVDGVCCDTACTGACSACTTAKKGSGVNGVCGNIALATDPDGECDADPQSSCDRNGSCNGAGACALYPTGTSCGATTCSAGTQQGQSCDGFGACNPSGTTQCAPYVCCSNACCTTCSTHTQCVGSSWCRSSDSTCQPDKANGATCLAPEECISGRCVDGVCCDTTCAGLCQACVASKKGTGTDGTCGPIAASTDPDADCPNDGAASCARNGLCNGSGACQLFAPGTACMGTTCTAGTQTGHACDGLGTCSPNVTTPCAPYSCCGAACCSTCSSDAGCTSSHFCDVDGQCKLDLAIPATCDRSAMCASGRCIDGQCCDSPCTGDCRACASALTGLGDGTCGNVIAGTDPDDDCASSAPSTCGTTGLCGSSGVCALHAAGTACAATSCSAGTQTGFACSGLGGCQPGQTTACAPYVCCGGACCTTCSADTDCVGSTFCSAASRCETKLANGADCTRGAMCQGGICTDGKCCDQLCDGPCEACSAAKKGAGTDGNCAPIAAGGDPDNDCTAEAPSSCGLSGACDGTGGCALYGQGTACGSATCTGTTRTGFGCTGFGACEPNQSSDCGAYVCCGSDCCSSCADGSSCSPGHFCAGGACVTQKAEGETCSGAVECSSGFCVDGVCCNTACDGLCQACSVATKGTGTQEGVCGAAAAGTDPHDDCPDDGAPSCDRNGLCDGQRQCAIYAAGDPCGTTRCEGNAVTGFLCDGAGTCSSAATSGCDPYACVGSACRTSCATSGSADCADDAFCDLATDECSLQKDAGDACTAADECLSDFCIDGVCCDGLCAGQCEACDVTGAVGKCTPVVGAPHAARPACTEGSSAEPCTAQICDGRTRTTCGGFVGTEIRCRAPSCSDGSANPAAFCNGRGSCPPPEPAACGEYACSGDVCGTSCTNDADCADKFRCLAAVCVPKDAAVCDPNDALVVIAPDGERSTCSPYVCEAGACRDACTVTDQCAPGHVCDTDEQRCIGTGAGAAADDGGCGCRLPRAPSDGPPVLLAGTLLALLARRRRHGASRTWRRDAARALQGASMQPPSWSKGE